MAKPPSTIAIVDLWLSMIMPNKRLLQMEQMTCQAQQRARASIAIREHGDKSTGICRQQEGHTCGEHSKAAERAGH